jgi:glycosyltransferase involved in cell wall biosynthesis
MTQITDLPTTRAPLVSIVVPAYNEAPVLPAFHQRLAAVLDAMPDCTFEVVVVNDGSSDNTLGVIESLQQQSPLVALVNLSRNFGKEIAMTAGLDHAHGDAVIVIDADLQDPPELIPVLIKEWQAGYDVVYARRSNRSGESWLKRASASAFYRVIQRMNRVQIPADTGDFRIMSRRAVNALLKLREHHRFMKGLFAWIGYRTKAIDYDRDPRFAGETKFNYWKLWNFALEGITSFSIAPLKIATYLGLTASLFAFVYLIKIVVATLLYGDPVRGYPTLMVTILFLGGAQLFFIGLIGEYVGRIFNETKHRPLYLVETYSPPKGLQTDSARLASIDSTKSSVGAPFGTQSPQTPLQS